MAFVVLIVAFIGAYLTITRLCPKLIAWFLVHRYNILVSLGKIGLHPLCVYDLCVRRDSVCLKADWLSLTSNLLNSQVHRPLSLQLCGVVVEYETPADIANVSSLLQSFHSGRANVATKATTGNVRGARGGSIDPPPSDASCDRALLSPKLFALSQFTGLYLKDVRFVCRCSHQVAPLYIGARNSLVTSYNDVTLSVDRLLLEGTNTIRNELTLLMRADSMSGRLVPSSDEYGSLFSVDGRKRALRDCPSTNSALVRWSGTLEVHLLIVQNASKQYLSDASVELTRPYLYVSDGLLPRVFRNIDRNRPRPPPTSSQSASRWEALIPRTASLSLADLVVSLDCCSAVADSAVLSATDIDQSAADSHSTCRLNCLLTSCRLETRVSTPMDEACVSLKMEDMRLEKGLTRLAALANLQLSVRGDGLKSSKPSLEIAVGIHTLQLSYFHSAVADWLAGLDLAPPISAEMNQSASTSRLSSVSPTTAWSFSLDVELWDLDTFLLLPDIPSLNTCLTHGKLSCGDGNEAEIVLETVSSAFAGAEPTTRHHVTGVLLLIGALLLRHKAVTSPADSEPSPVDDVERAVNVSVLLDNVQVELSSNLSRLIEFLGKTVNTLRYHLFRRGRSTTTPSIITNLTYSQIVDCSIQATNLNGFCLTQAGCTMLRIDSLVLQSIARGSTVTLIVDNCKLVAGLAVSVASVACRKSSELTSPTAHAVRVKIRLADRGSQLIIASRDLVTSQWSPLIHMQLLDCVNSITGWVVMATSAIKPSTQSSVSSVESRNDVTVSASQRERCLQQLTVKWSGSISIHALLSHTRRICLQSDNLHIVKHFHQSPSKSETSDDSHFVLTMSAPCFLVDDVQIVSVETFRLVMANRNKELTDKRQTVKDLHLKENRCVLVEIGSVAIVAPYEFNLTDALQEELTTTVKWLKKLHKRRGSASDIVANEPLPPDLCIKIRCFSLEICDNPFEVKLHDIYELLREEYEESLKRFQTLDKKMAELTEKQGLIPTTTRDSLYTRLRERCAGVYVSRSRRMYDSEPLRTRLMLIEWELVELTALADSRLHGHQQCVSIMRRMDPLSVWSEDHPPQFSTLWCREVVGSFGSFSIGLRDYPLKMLDIRRLLVWGRLIGAESEATHRSTRQVKVHVGEPFNDQTVDRSLMGLKFYYDLSADCDSCLTAYGPCWEPAVSLVQLCAQRVFSPPSLDPSPRLPFWDRIRLKLHGRFTLGAQKMTWLLHASLDPYNTTEEMELNYSDLVFDWTDGRLVLKGDLRVYVRTASRYDDCRMLYVPRVGVSAKLDWLCMGDPHDHHAVVPCAPDKLPEYSINQQHDSYRAYRSRGLDLSLALETKPKRSAEPTELVSPGILLFGSTLRWFERLQFILSGVSRPVMRGALFNNDRPRKTHLSRHYRKVRLSLNIHSYQLCYWMSVSRQHGVDMRGSRVSLSSEHQFSLRSVNDGVIRRSQSSWSVQYVNCELNDTEIWLQSELNVGTGAINLTGPVEKSFFLSVARLSYGRAAFVPFSPQSSSSPAVVGVSGSSRSTAEETSTPTSAATATDTPIHRLVVYNMKAAWTKSNRDASFAMFDLFSSGQQLKRNLSTDALRSVNIRDSTTPGSGGASVGISGGLSSVLKTPHKQPAVMGSTDSLGVSNPGSSALNSSLGATPSPLPRLQNCHAASMLRKLIADAESTQSAPVAFSEDVDQCDVDRPQLRGMASCQTSDVLHSNWLIELVNCQVLLKGIDTRGYVIITSSKSHVLQRVHRPVWRDCTLVSKTSWVGGLEGMQYYATVSAGGDDPSSENILWLTVDNIEGKAEEDIRDVPDMVGSGQSVGGVVSETVGGCYDDDGSSIVQLQRVVSRCRCEFYYASYGDTSVDPDTLQMFGSLQSSSGDLNTSSSATSGTAAGPSGVGGLYGDDVYGEDLSSAVDALTLIHHDLEVCTNSLQYLMVIDIVNNLLLYVAPQKRQTYDQLQSFRFRRQLSMSEDQRRPIQILQNRIRVLMSDIRQLERSAYMLYKQQEETHTGHASLSGEITRIRNVMSSKKELLNGQAQELAMMIHVYKETQLSQSPKLTARKEEVHALLTRTYEVCIRHAKWRLTDADGQLGIADVVVSNFQYSKMGKSDDSVEHLLELGYINMVNALPNQVYREVFQPADILSSMPVERQHSVRVFFRERSPVGGIRVKEHLEINIVPISIGLTYQFLKTMLQFCFPERDTESLDEEVPSAASSDAGATARDAKQRSATPNSAAKRERRMRRKNSNFYVPMDKDDVEKMKERAENNMLFIYIKIPEVTVRLSYKGKKGKNLNDVHNFLLTVPTLEYHNVTWTWLDLLVAMKNDTRRVLLSQAIKQKLQIGASGAAAEDLTPDEQSKTRLLFGAMVAIPGGDKSKRETGKKSRFRN